MRRKSALIAMLLVTSMMIFSGCGEKNAVTIQSNESSVVAEATGEIAEEVVSEEGEVSSMTEVVSAGEEFAEAETTEQKEEENSSEVEESEEETAEEETKTSEKEEKNNKHSKAEDPSESPSKEDPAPVTPTPEVPAKPEQPTPPAPEKPNPPATPNPPETPVTPPTEEDPEGEWVVVDDEWSITPTQHIHKIVEQNTVTFETRKNEIAENHCWVLGPEEKVYNNDGTFFWARFNSCSVCKHKDNTGHDIRE